MANSDTSGLTLYHMEYCGFCRRVRDVVDELGIDLLMKDTGMDSAARDELIAGGGKTQVPCLRIDPPANGTGSTRWMYESGDIIAYLRERFG